MINTIIFDIGNVLAAFRWKEYISNLGFDDNTCKALTKATVMSPIWNEYDRGSLTDNDICSQFIKQSPELEKEIQLFFENIEDIVTEYSYSVDWIRLLKSKGYQVLVLSNYPKTTFEHAQKNFKFLKEIDGGVISYEILHVKPEPEIYQALITKYNLTPSTCLFFDDRIENVNAAKDLGFNSIQFIDYDQAALEAAKLGVCY